MKVNKVEIIEYQHNNPCLTLKVIGKHFGVTSQYVSKVLIDAGIMIYKPQKEVLQVSCKNCEKLFYKDKYLVLHNINVDKQKYFFCSKRCQGKWLGNNYGFQIGHVKHANVGARKKYDYNKVLGLYKLHSASKVSKEMCIPLRYVYVIAYKLGYKKRMLH